MSDQTTEAPLDVESRLLALESSVAQLRALVEAAFATNNLAAPVAAPFLKEAAQHASGARFFALIDLGEALIKYSAALAFASVVHSSKPQSGEIMEMFKQPPTLGKLAERLRIVLDDPANIEWPLDILRAAFRKTNGKPTPAARFLFDDFIRMRNAERGHGAQQAEGYYEDLYLRNHLIVHDCIRASRHLQIPLVHINSLDNVNQQFAYKITLLMGAAPVRSPDPIETQLKLRVGSTCLWDHGTQLLPVSRFVAYLYCKTCMLEHVFFAERITEEEISYHSYVGNHRVVLEADKI